MSEHAPAATAEELHRAAELIDGWLAAELERNPMLVAVDRDDEHPHRWFARMQGEERSYTTIWLTLGQRALHAETYVLPAPEENHAAFYENLLRRNRVMHRLAFCIGDEDAVYLVGHVPVRHIDEDELDRVVGSTWAYVEQFFRPALRIGFASRLAKSSGGG